MNAFLLLGRQTECQLWRLSGSNSKNMNWLDEISCVRSSIPTKVRDVVEENTAWQL